MQKVTPFLLRVIKHPYSLYVAVALAILAPLLKRGFVQTLDMVFVPPMPMPEAVSSSYGLRASLHYVSLVVPADILQKTVLVSILLGTAIGMHRLFVQMYTDHFKVASPRLAALFAGLIYMVNPFTYSRFMAGQYFLLIAYALLPFFVTMLIVWLQRPTLKKTLLLASLATAISWSSIHLVGMAFFVGVVFVLAHVWRKRSDLQQLRPHFMPLLVLLLSYLLVNGFWLIPLFNGYSVESQAIAAFNTADQHAFATVGKGFGQLINVMLIHGFWVDDHNVYLLPEDMSRWWRVFDISLVGACLLGAGYCLKNHVRYGVPLAVIAIGGIIAATGTVGSLFAPINNVLGNMLPFFGGYREPQKFVVLVVMAYALFGGFALAWLLSTYKTRPAVRWLAWMACALPLLSAPLMLGGFNGQLRAQDFPPDWYRMRQQIGQLRTPDNSVLFLPWHLYMPLRFTGSVTANPARAFFGTSIIRSNDPELGGVVSRPPNPGYPSIDHIIKGASSSDGTTTSKQLYAHGIRYILVAKEFDYQDYPVDHWQGITPSNHTNSLILYKVPKQ